MKKFFAMLIAVAMVLSLVTVPAMAETKQAADPRTSIVTPVVRDAATVDEALNVPGGTLVFTNDATYPWVVDGDAAKSGNAGVASSTSSISTTVTAVEGDILQFDFKAWGEGSGTYWDHCDVHLDGERIFYKGAYDNTEWESFAYELTAGEHEVVWSYTKDSSVNPNGDYFAVDNVYVGQPVMAEEITVEDVTVPAGRRANVVYEVLPATAFDKSVTFAIADTSIATVDANGVVTGVAEGTTTITVTSAANPEVSGSATVNVTEALPTAHLEGFATYDLGSTYTKHFVAFTDADPGTVTDLVNFNTTTFAAAYYDGTVYGYNYNSSDSGAETNYYTMNAETYEIVYPGGDASAVNGVFAMAYNYADDTMYAITGADTRYIATVDLETGEVTNVALISVENPMTLAIDGEGNAYVLDLGSPATLYSLDLETGEATAIGSTGVALNYVQSMTWDHETNQLFWAQLASGTDHGLYVIDPETGAASLIGTIGASGMEVVGLYTKAVPGEEPPVEQIPITEVYVNGYEAPVAGEDSQNHLNFTVPADAHYAIDDSVYGAPCWWDNDEDILFSDIFVEGTNYSAGLSLNAAEGYYFADDVVIYVNNDENLVDWTYSGLDMDDNTICYVWTVPEPATAGEEPPVLTDLDEALNIEGGTLHFETDGTYPWIVVTEGDKVFAQSSNGGNHSTTSVLTLNVDLEEQQSIYFEFKAWGEGSYTFWDHCDFAIDGNVEFTYGAYDNDWELFTTLIPAGAHTLTWTYTKDGSVNPTGDYFAVDNVSIGEAPDVTVTFVDGINGETIDTLTVPAGTVLTEDMFPEAPEHTGYIFDGWDYNGEAVTVDTTITAMYHDPNSIIWDFETDPISQGFQFVDQDGDGFNWQWHVNTGSGNHTTHSGDGVATSASYDNDSEAALNPDNWMITPDFTGTLLTFWLVAQDTSWANDYLEVYVTTDGGETWSDALWSGYSPTSYTQYTIDLSAYSGTKNVAFRHFNCTDMFMLNVDDIEVSGAETPVEPTILGDVDGDGDVDLSDAVLLLRYCMGLIDLNDAQLLMAEVSGNETVSLDDAILIMRYAMGLIENFPIELMD